MPTYEYACSSCKHEWELEQSIKEDAITECPSCHNPTAKRQISRGGGFILKGGGWYADLYSSGSNKPSGAAATGAASGTTSASDGAAGGASGSAASPAAATPSAAPAASSGDSGASAPAKSSSAPASS
jgi:putative FmdB family regulatory protein